LADDAKPAWVKPFEVGLDSYSRVARLKPALITAAPVAFTLLAWAPGHGWTWDALVVLLGYLGVGYLLAMWARVLGLAKEPALWEYIGGRPTELELSHANARNKIKLAHRHNRLRVLIPDVTIPSAAEEQNDPAHAHDVYDTCTTVLKAKTRERKNSAEYELVFQENCNFGFFRNLWGLKPIGIFLSAAGVAILVARLYGEFTLKATVEPIDTVLAALNAAFLLAWLFLVRPKFIKVVAYSYADRLLETIDVL
jgi:hypothetical protein